jgi:hypothetical protein
VKHYEEEGGEDELYNLRKDPGEKHNLFADPPKRAQLESLERELISWQQKVKDPLLESPDFRSHAAKYLAPTTGYSR